MSLMLKNVELNAALLFSILSVWVLVGLFHYLSSHTGKRCFRIWTAGWLFYALFLTLMSGQGEISAPVLAMLKNCCISTAAVLMLWGSAEFLGMRTSQRLFGLTILFNAMWSYATAVEFQGLMWGQVPVFIFLGAAGAFTAVAFLYKDRRKTQRGAALLTFAFGFWALYLVAFPFLRSEAHHFAIGLLVASALQLFIAFSMIVLVLSEARSKLQATEEKFTREQQSRSQSEAEAESNAESHRKLLESTNEAVLIVSEDTLQVLHLNRAARKLLRAEETMPGTCLTNYCSLRNRAVTTAKEFLQVLPQNPEVDLTLPDGSKVRAQVRSERVRYRGQNSFQVLLLEVAQRASLARQLRQGGKMSALGQVISGVAHELNNPLAAIKGYTDLLLLTSNVDQQTRATLLRVSQESNRAAKLVHDLVAFARPETPRIEPISLHQMIQNVVKQREHEFAAKEIEIFTELSPSDPVVLANGDQMQQVLTHLLNNAVEALDDWDQDRRIEISTAVHDAVIQLRVEDSGPGIADDVAPRIFEPFFTTKPVGTGTGLGLSVCYTIILHHKGKVYHQGSGLGGACMVIELPLAVASMGQSEKAKIAAPDFSGNAAAKRAINMLVVDDEPSVGLLLRDMLLLSGYSVTVHVSPQEALNELQNRKFDIVLSDFRMPEMTGGELYQRAVELDARYADRFVIVTGDTMDEQTHDFIEESRVPSLLKPFQLTALQSTISKILEKQEPAPCVAAIG